MRAFICVIVSIICISAVTAETMNSYIGESTTITTACIRNSQLRGVSQNTSASIVIWDNLGNVVVPQTSMTATGNGTFVFSYIFTAVGSYSTRETCDFNGILADGSTLITVLKPNFGSMQVVAQGVAQVDINRPVVSEWLILLPNSTNTSTSSIAVTGGSCGVQDINGTQLPVIVTTATTSDKMTASFIAGQLDGFVEGANYQVLCNITLTDGMYVNGVKNYVYVNSQASFLQYILQLLGLAQSTSNIVNETLSITNQTLQIVQGLNNTGSPTLVYEQVPYVKSSDVLGTVSKPVIVSAKVLLGSTNVVDASCGLQLTNLVSGATIWQNATYNPVNEMYEYNWTPSSWAPYGAYWTCTGGNLSSSVVYGANAVEVKNFGLKAVVTK